MKTEELQDQEEDYFCSNRFKEAKAHFWHRMEGKLPSKVDAEFQLSEDYLRDFKSWCRFSRLLGDYKLPLQEMNHLLEVYRAEFLEHFPEAFADILHQRGDIHYYQGEYKLSIKDVEDALDIRNQYDLSNLITIGRYHLVAGKGVWKSGALYHALQHFAQALKSFHAVDSSLNDYRVGRLSFHLGQVYLQLEDYKLAEQLLKRSLQIFENGQLNPDHIYISAANSVLAKCLLNSIPRGVSPSSKAGVVEKLELAEKLLQRAKNNFEAKAGKRNHRNSASIESNFAKLHFKKHVVDKHPLNLQKALEHSQKEVAIRKKAFEGAFHPTISIAHGQLCEIHIKMRHFEQAITAANQAIANAMNISVFNLQQHPVKVDTFSSNVLPILLQSFYLAALAHWRLYKQSLDETLLNNACKLTDYGIEVGKAIRRQTTTMEQGKLTLGNNTRKINELALVLLYEKRSIELKKRPSAELLDLNQKIFEVFQRSKAISLLESIKSKKKPQSFLYQHAEGAVNHMEITLQEIEQLFKAYLFTTEAPDHQAKNASNIALIEKLELLSHLLNEDVQENRMIQLDEFWGKFQNPTGVILSYLVCYDAVFVMRLDSHQGGFDLLKLPFHNWYDVEKLRNSVSELVNIMNELSVSGPKHTLDIATENDLNTDTNYKIYLKLTWLHKHLLEPLKLDLREIKRLYIIPDDELAFLPFEILTPYFEEGPPESLSQLSYLIKSCPVSYHTAISILYNNHCTDSWIDQGSSAKFVETLLSMGVAGKLDSDGYFQCEDDKYFRKGMKRVYKLLLKKWPNLRHIVLDQAPLNPEHIKTAFTQVQIAHLFVHSVFNANKWSTHPAIILGNQSASEDYAQTIL